MEKTCNLLLSEWLVWRLHGEGVESDTFYGDFMI